MYLFFKFTFVFKKTIYFKNVFNMHVKKIYKAFSFFTIVDCKQLLVLTLYSFYSQH